jgi:hypothetical protein
LKNGCNIEINGSANFEVSLDNEIFEPSVTLVCTSSGFESTPVFVRLKQGLTAGTYSSENISVGINGKEYINISCSGVVDNAVGVTTKALNDVKVFPNPASEYVTIELGDNKSDIRIYNSAGLKVYEAFGVRTRVTIPTGELGNSGLYHIKINTQTQKLLVMRVKL